MAKAQEMTEKQMDLIADETGKALAEQKKVKVRLHMSQEQKQKLDAAEKAGKQLEWPYVPVQVNGYIYQIQLGKTVEVPETVAQILEEAGY